MKLPLTALLTIGFLSTNLFVTIAQAAAADPAAVAHPAATKVVIQISDNDPQKWTLALNNARNIQSALGARNSLIEIVAYGPGINMLKKGSAAASRIEEASLSGIRLNACQNTMRAMKLGKEDMLLEAGYVPAGVVEIIQRQQQGYAYLRP